ncbi:MAG: carbohydrate kinase family protein [Anaerovoracaceae bacterium]
MIEKGKIKAAVLGCVSVDIMPRFVSRGATSFADVIKPGAITRIEGHDICFGGPVANTGAAMKLFGVEPVLCAKIGQDDFGAMLKNMLQRETGEAALSGLLEDPELDTAYSIIMAPEGLDRAILQNPGANDDYSFADVDFDALQDCSLLHFGHPPSLKKIYRNEGEDLMMIFSRAKERGMVTSLDLCAVDPDSDAGRQDWKRILQRVLPYVDFFVPSIDELRYMMRSGDDASAAYLAALSRDFGASNVLIKCGTRGMYYSNADAETTSKIERDLGREAGSLADWADRRGSAKAKTVKKEVSGLGAGDTSIAAYLSAMLRGYPFEEALELALIEGALCVTQASSTGGLVPFEDLATR